MRKSNAWALLALSFSLSLPLHGQDDKPISDGLRRSAFGISLLGLAPRGEFADNVSGAGGIGGSYMLRLGEAGLVSLRADLGYMIYGRERYRTDLGGGPLGLINVDVVTTNNIVLGGLGIQIGAPGRSISPYANAMAGFSHFFTESSVEGTGNSEPFASSTNYEDGGFAWAAGGGIYIPVSRKRAVVNIDLGVRWLDNGKRNYLREDSITFEDDEVQFNPVRTEAKGIIFSLGVGIGFR
jgi:hypothetical protein